MRRQLLIPQVKILSLSSSNLQYSSFFYQIVIHNKRVIIRLLFQATKGHHIYISFPKRISFHFKKQILLVWKKEFFFFFTFPSSSSSFPIYVVVIAPSINIPATLPSIVSKIVGPLWKITLPLKTIVVIVVETVVAPKFDYFDYSFFKLHQRRRCSSSRLCY